MGECIPDICHFFYTGKIFGEKIYTEKRVNYNKRISRQSSVNRDLLDKANNKRVFNYTLTVGAHLFCVKMKKKYAQFCKDYTHLLFALPNK